MQLPLLKHQSLPDKAPEQDNQIELPIDVMVDKVADLARDIKAFDKTSSLATLPISTQILENSGRWLFISDIGALITAFFCGGLAAWIFNIHILHTTFQKLINRDTLGEFLMFAVLGIGAMTWLEIKGHYRQRLPHWEAIGHIITVAAVGLVMGGFLQFAMKGMYSRLWIGLSWTLFAVFLFAGRALVMHTLKKKNKWYIPALIIGDGPTADALQSALTSEPYMGFAVTGKLSATALKDMKKPHAWSNLLRARNASHFFIALEGSEMEAQQVALKSLVRGNIPYSVVPPWLGLPSSTMTPHHFMMRDVMLLHNTNRLTLPLPRFVKRSFDVVLSAAALIMLSPLMLCVALAVRRDGGPAFFTQKRVGLHGELFDCYKFRSMRVDAEEALKNYLANNPIAAAEWEKYQKLKLDPRITRLGDFIRRTSIDELPQLINVLLGNMSLVGPRPIMRGQEMFYGDDFVYYGSVRPGITGPWQVSGRNKLTFKQRVDLEAWYARNWNVWMDIVILLKTVSVLLKKDQAF